MSIIDKRNAKLISQVPTLDWYVDPGIVTPTFPGPFSFIPSTVSRPMLDHNLNQASRMPLGGTTALIRSEKIPILNPDLIKRIGMPEVERGYDNDRAFTPVMFDDVGRMCPQTYTFL
jgi:hypothetical protein